jgi:hypothetical protein
MPEIFGVAFIAAVAIGLVHTAWAFWRRRLYALGLLAGLVGAGLAGLLWIAITSPG